MKQTLNHIIRHLNDLLLWMALVIFGRNIKLATTWNQLTELQLQDIAAALEHYHRFKDCRPEKFQALHRFRLYLKMVKNLLRTNNFGKVWIALQQIPPEEYQEHAAFLTGEIQRTKFPASFMVNGKQVFPPADRLQNITIKEFSFIDSLYYNWRKSSDDRYLDLLCATLYRPAGASSRENDRRRSFDKYFSESDVVNFKKVPLKMKLAIAYTYEGCRNYIVKQYPHVFPKAEPQDPDTKLKQKQTYTPFGKLLHFKIQFDHSKLEAVQNLNIHDFFGPYENELIEMKNQK